MDQFVKGKIKAIDEVSKTHAGAGNSKAKCRKYIEVYLALGFTHRVYTGCYSCRPAPLHIEAVYTGRTHQSDHCRSFEICVSTLYLERGISLMSGICCFASCRAASSVDSVTHNNNIGI